MRATVVDQVPAQPVPNPDGELPWKNATAAIPTPNNPSPPTNPDPSKIPFFSPGILFFFRFSLFFQDHSQHAANKERGEGAQWQIDPYCKS